jgi:hypothetical protein
MALCDRWVAANEKKLSFWPPLPVESIPAPTLSDEEGLWTKKIEFFHKVPRISLGLNHSIFRTV